MLEQFQTDTADYADIVLPVTTFLEHTDLYLAYGHYYLQLARPALPAPGETKPNVEIFRLLAEAMGFDDSCFDDTEDDMIRQALDSGHPFLEGITLERLDAEHFVRLNIPDAVSAVCRGRVPDTVRASATSAQRTWSTRHRSNRGSATASCVREYPLEFDLGEERRQHELDLRNPARRRRANRGRVSAYGRCAASGDPVRGSGRAFSTTAVATSPIADVEWRCAAGRRSGPVGPMEQAVSRRIRHQFASPLPV